MSMTKKELLDQAFQASASMREEEYRLQHAAEAVTAEFPGPYGENHLRMVLQRADALREAQSDSPGAATSFKATPWGIATKSQLLAAIEDQIEITREEIAKATQGAISLPFTSWKEAVDWIEREQAKPRNVTEQHRRRVRELQQELQDRLTELRDLQKAESYSFGTRRLTVEYVKPESEWAYSVIASPDSPLSIIARAVNELAAATGFSKHELTLYVLADRDPSYPRASITVSPRSKQLSDGTWITRTQAMVTMRSPEFSYEQVRQLHRSVREEWGVKKSQALTENDVLVLGVVNDLDKTRQGGATRGAAFWQKAIEELAAKGKRYTNPRSAEAAYRRARAKLTRTVHVSKPLPLDGGKKSK